MELFLIIVLSILSILLGVALYFRLRSESNSPGALKRMSPAEFSELLRTNSAEGNIQAVAAKVSSLLIKSFGVRRIVFLRKRRGTLELNYYHGIADFDRREFRLQFNQNLAVKLSKDFLPMRLDSIKALVPGSFYTSLTGRNIDTYFPIYWRNNLYGVYFVDSGEEMRSPAYSLLIASIAHSLSAAYHIKWHETRLKVTEEKLPKAGGGSAGGGVSWKDFSDADFLALVKLKDSKILLGRILELLSKNLGFTKFTLIRGPESTQGEESTVDGKRKENLTVLERMELNKLIPNIKSAGPQKLSEIKGYGDADSVWLERLKKSGHEYVFAFPLEGKEEGILAWSGPGLSSDVKLRLLKYRKLADELFDNAEAFQKAEIMSYTDALTGLSNQRYMYKRLEEEINRSRRYSRPLAFVIIDIDDLKTINDTYGHQAGDALLKQVGQALKKSTRGNDIIARYGGDEFCVVMPESDEETGVKFMSRMLETIAQTEINFEGKREPLHCSVSMGGALFPKHAQDAEKLIYAADMALLQAKERGRNRFLIHGEIESQTGR